ncbi:right-handed parallel beta-helix repeat-containing protein [Sphingobium sufflavum]|uniref:right-handed parallel beta-helix repeat-containing protein n=1 Tax=Sphingobium sufflavum TaxID=1129547 RepID=UPI001F34740F|nr:right-handed parallel beta-helix repeat-containing protein [Sphingobium sufflavum]MCE7796582.1 right-handed parallel beta-helix repeat-containing protein [Sphingobium sufflavum]
MPSVISQFSPGLRRNFLLCAAIIGLTAANAASAASYYVNATTGDDRNTGLSDTQAWRTLARARDFPFQPGDQLLLASGSVWREPLVLSRSGRRDAPISVGRTGVGAKPRIDAGGVSPHAVLIRNAEFVSVSGLEVTNDGPPTGPRYGVFVSAENVGVTRGIRISDMYIHDVRGTNDRKDNGGIVFQALGLRLRTRFEGLTVERNIIWRVDRSGIAGISDQVTTARWFPSRQIIIRDNYLEDIGGDGIVPRGTDGALIEHNIVRYAASRAPGYNVAIWQWSTDNSLMQLNEAAFTRGRYDGQGFDSDFNSRRTRIIYNYSHDNAGGFLLICSPRSNDTDNLGNRGTVARFNVSRNDGTRIIQLSGAVTDALVERNVIHVGKGMDVQMVVATEWQGWASDVRLRHNLFAVAGTARYGREVGRSGPDYLIAPGFLPAEQIKFSDNQYLGLHIDRPQDDDAVVKPDYKPPVVDWAVPTFDPAKPDNFADFLARHRSWMLAMLARELGRPVELERARGSSPFELRR